MLKGVKVITNNIFAIYVCLVIYKIFLVIRLPDSVLGSRNDIQCRNALQIPVFEVFLIKLCFEQ